MLLLLHLHRLNEAIEFPDQVTLFKKCGKGIKVKSVNVKLCQALHNADGLFFLVIVLVCFILKFDILYEVSCKLNQVPQKLGILGSHSSFIFA